jgi:cation transport ATPase
MEHAHNFEISSALITIILLGKYIEQLSKKKTVDKLSQLASLKVSKAYLVDGNEGHREVEVELVEVGDLIKVTYG